METLILKALFSVLTRIAMSVASEQVLSWALFKTADEIVKSTKTKHDEEFLNKVKEAYEQGK